MYNIHAFGKPNELQTTNQYRHENNNSTLRWTEMFEIIDGANLKDIKEVISQPGPLLTKRTDILPQDLVKPLSREIQV